MDTLGEREERHDTLRLRRGNLGVRAVYEIGKIEIGGQWKTLAR